MPPSAITVCALPNSDLQMIAVRSPASRASIAARSPAPPAPMTTTSKWWRSCSVMWVPSHRCRIVVGRQLRKRKSLIQPADTAMT